MKLKPQNKYGVKRGEIWCVGGCCMGCGRIENGDHKALFSIDGTPTLTYVDPPWNQAALTRFYRDLPYATPKYIQFLKQLVRIVAATNHDVFVEIGNKQVQNLQDLCRSSGGKLLHTWEMKYGNNSTHRLLHFTWKQARFERSLLTNTNVAHPLPFLRACSVHDEDLIFDPCMGTGTTAIAADKLGARFLGLEINPFKLTVAINRLSKQTGLAPARIGEL